MNQQQQQAVLKMDKKALTLLEIIISTVILAIVMTGLVNVFVASKKLIQHSRYRMNAGEIGKKFFDPLQAYVREDGWNASCFGTNQVIANCENVTTSIPPYNATYSISNLSVDTNIKKVTANITWTE
jgi:Tfp pilus assembly protein PilV